MTKYSITENMCMTLLFLLTWMLSEPPGLWSFNEPHTSCAVYYLSVQNAMVIKSIMYMSLLFNFFMFL